MKKQAVLPFTDPRGSSWLGRYLAQKAIRQQSRNDDPNVAVATIPTAAMMAVPPLAIPGYYANELVSNSVVQGNNPVEADRILSKTVKDLTLTSGKIIGCLLILGLIMVGFAKLLVFLGYL